MLSSSASPLTRPILSTTSRRRFATRSLTTCSLFADGARPQWISEVLHFCQGLPIILVGCKKDLRYDQKTIEELHKTSQKPVTPEQVRLLPPAAERVRRLADSPAPGRRRPQEDRRAQVPRVLGQDQRRRPRSFRARNARRAAHPQEGEEEVQHLVN